MTDNRSHHEWRDDLWRIRAEPLPPVPELPVDPALPVDLPVQPEPEPETTKED